MAEAERKAAALSGNPLTGGRSGAGGSVKRAWNSDVLFRNQAKSEPDAKRRYINDPLRNDAHKRFMSRYMK